MSTQFAPIWNNASVDFSCIKANVTDSNSGSNSTLLDLQVGGVSKFNVAKSGNLTVNAPKITLNGSISLQNNAGGFELYRNAGQIFYADASNCYVGGAFRIGFNNGLVFEQDAAGIFAQRNGTSAQTYRIYKTYTDATNNFERGKIGWSGDIFQIGTEKGLTSGAARALELQTDGTTRLTIGTTGVATFAQSNAVFGNHNGAGDIPLTLTAYSTILRLVRTGLVNIGLGELNGDSFAIRNDGDSSIMLAINASTKVTTFYGSLLRVAGTTSSFPAIKRNSAALNFRLADDSADCDITAAHGAFSAGTDTVSNPILNLTQTWNNNATTFTGLLANFTDTASASGSLLMDLQVGGLSKTKIKKDGTIVFRGAGIADATIGPVGSYALLVYGADLYLKADYGFYIQGNPDFNGYISLAGKAYLHGEATNVLALRNSTNAQTFRIYKTYTDATNNFERGKIGWSGDIFQIGTEKGLTSGAARALELQTDGTTRLTIGTTGDVTLASGVLYLVGSSSSDMRLRKTSSGGATFELGNGSGYAGFIAGSIQSFVGSGSTTLRDSVGNLVVTNPESSTANVRLGSAYSTYPGVYCNNILNVMSETGTRFIVGGTSEKMRINTNGNVLINTTTDDGASKLQVNGDITAAKATLSATLDLTIRTVTYGATMAIDAALGNKIAITLAGNGTISNPTNAVDGRVLVFRLRQDATGSRIPVWDTKYSFVGDLATVTLSTAANKIDRVAFEYDSTDDKWYCISFIKGS